MSWLAPLRDLVLADGIDPQLRAALLGSVAGVVALAVLSNRRLARLLDPADGGAGDGPFGPFTTLTALIGWTATVALALGGGALVLLAAAASRGDPMLAAVAATGALVVLVRWRRLAAINGARAVVRATARAEVDRHLPALVRNSDRLVRADDYGNPIIGKWYDELGYFVDRVVAATLSPRAAAWLGRQREATIVWIDRLVHAGAADGSRDLYDDRMSPLDYERLCARRLAAAGWTVRLTRASGDQGADIVAKRAGVTLVVQCKKAGRPVGNKAVQEVIAARDYERADRAAVVSNAAYTRQAQDLAHAADVALLHHRDLSAERL